MTFHLPAFMTDGPEDEDEILFKVGDLKLLLRRIHSLEGKPLPPPDLPEGTLDATVAKIKNMADLLGYKLVPLDEALAARAMLQKGGYEHTFVLAFTARSNLDDGEDMTSDIFKNGIYRRIEELDSEGELAWKEALLPPER